MQAEGIVERRTSAPDRNLALELVRVTEAAALGAARWVGRGDKEGADQVAVVVLDRDRHQELIQGLREAGAKVMLITDGDVAPAIAAAREESAVDLLYGIGGTPEGVISAAALKCLGGAMQGRLWPRNDEERRKLLDAGYDIDKVLTIDDLVAGQDVFVAATGVTTGALLQGVRYTAEGAVTESIVMRSRSGTIRRIEARHAFEKLMKFSKIAYR